MRACPKCYALNDDDAMFCAECQSPMLVDPATAKPRQLSDAGLRADEARRRYENKAPSSADLTPQQWYNVAKFYPKIAARAHEFSHRPLPEVGPDNPLDATATAGPIAFWLKRRGQQRMREPGEEE